jgi:3-dehydroquinate dehydratase-2
MTAILVLHGPNLNLLGTREPTLYGSLTLDDINQRLLQLAQDQGFECQCLQSNSEHTLIDRIHQTRTDGTACILFNPAAFTHTSIALRDALLGVRTPMIEVHLSNVHAREAFRHHSYFSDIAIGTIGGFGHLSYELALQAAITYLKKADQP